MSTKKTKKLLAIILLGIMVVAIVIIQLATMNTTRVSNGEVNDTFTVDGLKYKITSINPAEVAVHTFAEFVEPNTTIPNAVESKGTTYSVTSIGNGAFYESELKSIFIPQSVITIGKNAFAWCATLASVEIENTSDKPSKLETIGDLAFLRSGLEAIVIPQSVITIGKNAFAWCDTLASVEIENTADKPSKLETIDYFAFCSVEINSIIIPQSVTSIGERAFFYCQTLRSVTIENTSDKPSKLETIGEEAFFRAGLNSIAIPQSVITIGEKAFYWCYALARVEIENTDDKPSKLETIGENAFDETVITSIVLPQSMTTIGNSAFYQCADLSVLVFSGATVPTFGAELFATAGKDIMAYVPFAQKNDYNAALEDGEVLDGYEHVFTTLGYGELVMPANALADAPILESDYSQTIVATGGIEGEAVTYEITGGALPDGLSMDNKGNITRTATKVGKSTFTVTAQVSNALAKLSYSSEKSYKIKVRDTIGAEPATKDSGSGIVKTGDALATPIFFIMALFSVMFILANRKKEELQG